MWFSDVQRGLGDVGSCFPGAAIAYAAVGGRRAGVTPEPVLAPLAIYPADAALVGVVTVYPSALRLLGCARVLQPALT